MTFSVSRNGGDFEWSGKNPLTLFSQPSNLLRPRMWRMVWDIIRFNALATRAVLQPKDNDEISLGEWLKLHGFSDLFVEDFILVSRDECTTRSHR